MKNSRALAPSELDRLEREIAATDAEIDELVYELYGITEEERKIIEGAYRRFMTRRPDATSIDLLRNHLRTLPDELSNNQMAHAVALPRGSTLLDNCAVYLAVVRDDRLNRFIPGLSSKAPLQRIHDVFEAVVQIMKSKCHMTEVKSDLDFKAVGVSIANL
jgi:hypothetical protein